MRRRVHPRTRVAGGARRRQVVEDRAGNVGRVRSERSERSPPQSLLSSRCNIKRKKVTNQSLRLFSHLHFNYSSGYLERSSAAHATWHSTTHWHSAAATAASAAHSAWATHAWATHATASSATVVTECSESVCE